MEDRMKGWLLAISGWGTGLAILFAIFSERCGLNEAAYSILDLVLSTLTATCFLVMTAAISREFAEPGKSPSPSLQAEKSGILAGAISSILIIALGLYFSLYVPLMHEPTKSATTIGALTLGFGVIYLHAVFTRLFAAAGWGVSTAQGTTSGTGAGFSPTEESRRRLDGRKNVKRPSASNGFIAVYLVMFSGLLLMTLYSAFHSVWVGKHDFAFRMIEPAITYSALLWLGLNIRRIEAWAALATSPERPPEDS